MPLSTFRRSDNRFRPHLYRDGTYHLHERQHGSARNRATNVRRVVGLDEVAVLIRTGRYVLRMSVGGKSSPISLIQPDDVEIAEIQSAPAALKREAQVETSVSGKPKRKERSPRNGKVHQSCWMEEAALRRLSELGRRDDRTLSYMINKAIREYVARADAGGSRS